MIDLHSTIVNALNTIGLPVHYEMVLHKGLAIPCISYMEITNYIQEQTDVSEVCFLSYQVKVWSNKISELQSYSIQIDSVMRGLNFKRTGSAELYDNNSSMMQKVLTYERILGEDISTPSISSAN